MDNENIEILFAEDSEDDATLTMRALKKCGVNNKLQHVIDGAEALDYLFCKGNYAERNFLQIPKLIILDLKMPKISGIQVLKKIKSDPVLKLIPVIMLTSSKEDPDIKQCYSLGANSYIVKPVDNDAFFLTIKELGLYWMKLSQPA